VSRTHNQGRAQQHLQGTIPDHDHDQEVVQDPALEAEAQQDLVREARLVLDHIVSLDLGQEVARVLEAAQDRRVVPDRGLQVAADPDLLLDPTPAVQAEVNTPDLALDQKALIQIESNQMLISKCQVKYNITGILCMLFYL